MILRYNDEKRNVEITFEDEEEHKLYDLLMTQENPQEFIKDILRRCKDE